MNVVINVHEMLQTRRCRMIAGLGIYTNRCLILFFLVLPLLLAGTSFAATDGSTDAQWRYQDAKSSSPNRKPKAVVKKDGTKPPAPTNHSSGALGDDEQSRLIHYAESFLGAPYRFGGEGKQGMDCSAFVKKIFAEFGVDLPRSAREQFKVGVRVPRDELTVGDLVFFRTKRTLTYPTHVGIFTGSGQFIHASAQNPRCVKIDDLSSDFYSRMFAGGTRPKQLPDAHPQVKVAPETSDRVTGSNTPARTSREEATPSPSPPLIIERRGNRYQRIN
jgi:cell wall-associated NlpC family hydrolase